MTTELEYGLLPADFTAPGEPVSMSHLFGVLRNMKYEQAQRAQIAEYLRVVKGECEVAIGLIDRRLDELTERARGMAELLTPEGSKHIDLPGLGRIQFRDYQPGYTVADADVLLKWAVEHEREELFEYRPVLDKKSSLELAREGEELPGIDPTAAHRTMSIQFEGPK